MDIRESIKKDIIKELELTNSNIDNNKVEKLVDTIYNKIKGIVSSVMYDANEIIDCFPDGTVNTIDKDRIDKSIKEINEEYL